MKLIQTTDELYLLNTISKWRNYNSLECSYEDSHSFHARNFISLLNPVYLSAFKNIESLNNFQFIQARDGVIDLLKFFYKYKTPDNLLTKILIDQRLGHIVPTAWHDNVILYKGTTSLKNKDVKSLIFSHTFITSSFDKELVESISEKYSFEEIYIFGDCAPENLHHFHRVNSEIERIFNKKSTYLTLDDIRSMNAREMMLLEDKSNLLSFTKSFLSWELIVAGAKPYSYEEVNEINYLESPYSSIEISPSRKESSADNIYLWLEKNAKALHLYEFNEDIHNSNNLQRTLNQQTVNFAMSVLYNAPLFNT